MEVLLSHFRKVVRFSAYRAFLLCSIRRKRLCHYSLVRAVDVKSI